MPRCAANSNGRARTSTTYGLGGTTPPSRTSPGCSSRVASTCIYERGAWRRWCCPTAPCKRVSTRSGASARGSRFGRTWLRLLRGTSSGSNPTRSSPCLPALCSRGRSAMGRPVDLAMRRGDCAVPRAGRSRLSWSGLRTPVATNSSRHTASKRETEPPSSRERSSSSMPVSRPQLSRVASSACRHGAAHRRSRHGRTCRLRDWSTVTSRRVTSGMCTSEKRWRPTCCWSPAKRCCPSGGRMGASPAPRRTMPFVAWTPRHSIAGCVAAGARSATSGRHTRVQTTDLTCWDNLTTWAKSVAN